MYKFSPSGNWLEYKVIVYKGKKNAGRRSTAAIRTAILLPNPKGLSKNRVSFTRKLSGGAAGWGTREVALFSGMNHLVVNGENRAYCGPSLANCVCGETDFPRALTLPPPFGFTSR